MNQNILWNQIMKSFEGMKASNKLNGLVTKDVAFVERGIPMTVQQLSSTIVKPIPKSGERDVFLNPTQQELFVTAWGPSHSVLMNKFYIVPLHCVLVTNDNDAAQTDDLSAGDFSALFRCIQPSDTFPQGAIGFYNQGALSGASQPHKHMQFLPFSPVPFPFSTLPDWYERVSF